MRKIVIIAHNLRSAHNIGSLLRTADAMGVEKVFLTGYTPFPKKKDDPRLPHLANKTDKAIAKTALGAEESMEWQSTKDVKAVIDSLKDNGYEVIALEQTKKSENLNDYQPSQKVAIVLGREVEGLEPEVIERCDKAIEIPMLGRKESLNVVQAAAMALYHCRFI